jgi:hypothetical protein
MKEKVKLKDVIVDRSTFKLNEEYCANRRLKMVTFKWPKSPCTHPCIRHDITAIARGSKSLDAASLHS